MPSKWPSNPAMRTKLVFVLGLLLAAACAQALEFRSVKSHGAIMHEAPWASSKKLYVLSQGYPVEVIGSQPDWVRVRDAAGGVAWMSTASLSNQRTVVATANRTELRRSPDAKAALAFSVDKDVVLQMVEPPKNGWVKLRHADGSSGYGQISAFWGL